MVPLHWVRLPLLFVCFPLMRADVVHRIGLASYVYSLDNQTTSNYLAFATSYFGEHSLISSIQVAQSILGACFPSERFPAPA